MEVEMLPMLTAREIAKVTGVNQNTIISWCFDGILQPALPNVLGVGRPHLFSSQQCLGMAIVCWFHLLLPVNRGGVNRGTTSKTRSIIPSVMKEVEQYSDGEIEYMLGEREGPEVMTCEEKFAALGQERNTMRLRGNKLGDEAAEAYRDALTRMRDYLRAKMARAKAKANGRRRKEQPRFIPPSQQPLAARLEVQVIVD
jgi:hypothetical protein